MYVKLVTLVHKFKLIWNFLLLETDNYVGAFIWTKVFIAWGEGEYTEQQK